MNYEVKFRVRAFTTEAGFGSRKGAENAKESRQIEKFLKSSVGAKYL